MVEKNFTIHREDKPNISIPIPGKWDEHKLTFGAKADYVNTTALSIDLKNTLAGGTDEMTVSYNATTNITTVAPIILPANTGALTDERVYYEVEAVNASDATDITTIAKGTLFIDLDVINAYNGTPVEPTEYLPLPLANFEEDQIPQKQGGTFVGVSAVDLFGDIGGVALGETETTAFRGDHGADAYAHSQTTHDKSYVGLSHVDNTSDLNKPISTAQQTALDNKADLVGGIVPTSQLPSLAPSDAQKNSDITQAEILAKITATAGTNGQVLTLSSSLPVWADATGGSSGLLPDGTVTGATTQAQAFTNGIVSPTITGGTGVSDKITYKSTTGAGTGSGIAHQFTGGTNGATTILTMLNNGDIGIGFTSTIAKLSVNGSISAGSSNRVATGSGVHVGYGGAFETNNGGLSIAYYMPADISDNYSSIIRNSYSDGQIKFNVSGGSAGGNITKMTMTKDGKIGVGTTSPTSLIHIAAGTATANTAPLKLTTGTLNSTAEAGAIEYNNTFHLTNSDATRRHVVTAPNTTKVTAGAPYTNDGYVVINIGGSNFNVMTTA